jgi:hypothetical protein
VVARADVEAFVAPILAAPTEEILWAAWETVVAAADHAPQEPLVALVAGVKGYPAPDQPTVWGLRVLADLPVFGAQMREAWNAPSVTLNAFAARLTPDVVDFLLLGLWTIGEALETFADPATHVPAAVEWFRHAGLALAEATVHGRTYAGRPGELAVRAGVAEPGFSVPRWAFWRSRLEGLAREGDRAAKEGFRLIKRHDSRIATYF